MVLQNYILLGQHNCFTIIFSSKLNITGEAIKIAIYITGVVIKSMPGGCCYFILINLAICLMCMYKQCRSPHNVSVTSIVGSLGVLLPLILALRTSLCIPNGAICGKH